MKELDVLLTSFLEQHYEQASSDSQQCFRELLEWPDPELFSLLMGRTSAPDADMEILAEQLRSLMQKR